MKHGFESLTSAERRIAVMVQEGMTTATISKLTGRSSQAISRVRRTIRRKLAVPTTRDLAAFLSDHHRLAESAGHEAVAGCSAKASAPVERRSQLLLRASLAELKRLSGRAQRYAMEMDSTGDPLAASEATNLRIVAAHTLSLHDELVAAVRSQGHDPARPARRCSGADADAAVNQR